MTTLLIATRNNHKVGEIRAILGDKFRYLTLADLQNPPSVVEDADTFEGNASKKATELARWLISNSLNSQPSTLNYILADDSGLEVDALNGAPGVHSARFAALDRSAGGPPASGNCNTPDADNNAKLLRLLKDVPLEKRTARFRCVIALVELDSSFVIRDSSFFNGACEGRIGFELRGTNGFGYDPLFLPDGYARTYAEIGDDEKNRISHRARALWKLSQALRDIGPK
ncbi:MAG TPA: RdgB/HAM1 family non-canonical purine NTP pyrophosphatase [Verrucomicrobiota bacterium]|nr:RdgB/HAM1 family non-canonical purine NTP pyrophosphatase [Verrucomicrobiota bacterium]